MWDRHARPYGVGTSGPLIWVKRECGVELGTTTTIDTRVRHRDYGIPSAGTVDTEAVLSSDHLVHPDPLGEGPRPNT